jgi:hypothetical protein
MKNVLPAFEFQENDMMQPGFKKIDCHMLFDLKLDLVRKAQFIAGDQTDPPKESVYSSFVSHDSVHLAFLIAALNDFEMLSPDVQNAYLNAPTKEKIYTIAGPEFGQGKEGQPVMIVRALYGCSRAALGAMIIWWLLSRRPASRIARRMPTCG